MGTLSDSDWEFKERVRLEEARFENERAIELAEESKYWEEKAKYLYKQTDIETRIKEAYEKIKEQRDKHFQQGVAIEVHAGWMFQQALEIIGKECPEVLDDRK